MEITTGISVSFRVVRMTTDVDPGEFFRGGNGEVIGFFSAARADSDAGQKAYTEIPEPSHFCFFALYEHNARE